ncbi:MAG: hypothetical protein IPM69_14085 [Ignavibacteria bacterium]|nr:hypothetical protein [Ignavibacteria bacterium]
MKSASLLLKAMFVAILFTIGLSQTQAQIQITVGTQTQASTGTAMWSPYDRWYTSEHKQYLVTAAELNAAGAVPGDIKGLAFNVSSVTGANGLTKGWTLKMKLTSATALTNPLDISGLTEVIAPVDLTIATTGWYQHDFVSTIFWDGVSNILIDQCYNNYFGGADYTTTGANVWCSTVPAVNIPTHILFTDGANYCGLGSGNFTNTNYRPQMRFEFRPVGVKNTFPKSSRIVGMPDSSLLRSNAIYDGTNAEAPAGSRPGVTFGSIPGFTTTFTYTITGPLPSNTVVYRGLDAAGQTTMTAPAGGGNMFIPNASGLLANPSTPLVANGTGFLNTAVPPNQGGTYRLTVVATTTKGTQSFVQTVVNDFVIAVDRDMTAVGLSRPLSKNQQVYFKTNNIPITGQFKNVGVQPVMSYKGICEIRNSTTGVLVRRDEVIRTANGGGIPPGGILTGVIDEFDFPSFTTIQADSFSITICTELLDPIPDQQAFNDCYPLAGAAPFTFIVKNLIDYEIVNITSPSSGIYAGRPATPSAQIANNGAFADPIPVFLNIRLLPNTPIITNQMVLVEVPNGIFNKAVVSFPPFTPPAGGQYEICIKAAQQGDEVPANDEKCITITVVDRLAGDFTVGTNTKPGVPGFPTIQAAVDALYQRGVRANVRFLLTDPFYAVGNTSSIGTPALDLSSNIIGIGPNSSVTWIADPQSTGLSKAGVTIQLNSSNGIGVYLGQNSFPANFNAVQLEFPNKENANSPGYMEFDGGAQKSLKFQLRTFANRRAVFYVGKRAYNNTIKNCIIELDANTPELDFWSTIPGVTIESNAFKFGADSSGFGANFSTFTAGIFQRNMPPANEFGNNREGLDTGIVLNNVTYYGNKANKFIGNEIRGFAYGIASIGIGTLKKNNKLTRYYNSGTEIRDNMISNVRRAGVFFGL